MSSVPVIEMKFMRISSLSGCCPEPLGSMNLIINEANRPAPQVPKRENRTELLDNGHQGRSGSLSFYPRRILWEKEELTSSQFELREEPKRELTILSVQNMGFKDFYFPWPWQV